MRANHKRRWDNAERTYKGYRESDIYRASLNGHHRLALEAATPENPYPERHEIVQRATVTKEFVVQRLRSSFGRERAITERRTHQIAARDGGKPATPESLRQMAQQVNAAYHPTIKTVAVKPRKMPAWACSFANYEEVKP